MSEDDRKPLIDEATQKALERFDETMRELALLRYEEIEAELPAELTRCAVSETVLRIAGSPAVAQGSLAYDDALIDDLTAMFTDRYGHWLAKNRALEDVTQLGRDITRRLKERGMISDEARALEPNESWLLSIASGAGEPLGGERRDFARELLAAVERRRDEIWRERVRRVNWELFDRGAEAYCWYALQEVASAAARAGVVAEAPHAGASEAFAAASLAGQLGKPVEGAAARPFVELSEELVGKFKKRVFFWPRQTGPKGDLVDDEMGRVSKQVEAALKPLAGARDVIAAPFMGKGYVEVDIDRERAARYGISVQDIESEIEVALAGKVTTYTVEDRDRFPVRVRYVRSQREEEESIRRLLVSSGVKAAAEGAGEPMAGGQATGPSMNTASPTTGHSASPVHASRGKPLIPLSALAEVKVVEGPAMIKSENSQLVNYVTLNVRGRDIVGFVDEAQRVVAAKVKLPEGVHLEWSGEFEHQVRAAKTLRFVFPAVIVLIFVILYLTYHDLMDAVLMMLAVPEALAGGAFFMYLFSKIVEGWEAPPMDFSVAVWVGFIACFGMATETGIIMLVYLRKAIEKRGGLENIQSLAELRQAVIEGAVHRLRPKLLTEGVAIIAIFPMVFAKGVGGEILAPMALPVLGGLLISDEVVDLFLPVRFYWVRRRRWLKLQDSRRHIQSRVAEVCASP